MDTYLYMTVFPEALVASMLPPENYAAYAAVGSRKRIPGRAILFEVNRDLVGDTFDLSPLDTMEPHPDGKPKHSATISIYRVLEQLPLEALGRLFLVTRDGKHLGIEPQPYAGGPQKPFRLYQEVCPMHPTVVSKLGPEAFGKFITDVNASICVPKLLFVDLLLGEIADPDSDVPVRMLPYADIGLIRDGVEILKKSERHTIVVDRAHAHDFFYRTVGEGFFLAAGTQLLHYPFPAADELETTSHDWWRSAELS